MPTFYSPSGNPEVWAECPPGYLTEDAWYELTYGTEALQERIAQRQEAELQSARSAKLAQIDAETSAVIFAGFDYEVDGETLHFSYDADDQRNFADSANAATLAKLEVPGLPESVKWNGWRVTRDAEGNVTSRTLVQIILSPDSFLTLYTAGALAHKASCMERGGRRKAALEQAQTLEEIEAV